MDVSGSLDRVFDFPDGETPWTYGGFAPGLPLGYTGNPSGSGGWLEADDLPIYAMRTTAVFEPVIEVVAPLVEEVREPIEPIVAPMMEEIAGPMEPMDAPTIGGDEDMEPLFSASDGEYDPDLHAVPLLLNRIPTYEQDNIIAKRLRHPASSCDEEVLTGNVG
ncbi:hypothetical protein Tco_0331429 [Tanacetum coccineum]